MSCDISTIVGRSRSLVCSCCVIGDTGYPVINDLYAIIQTTCVVLPLPGHIIDSLLTQTIGGNGLLLSNGNEYGSTPLINLS